MTYTQQSFSTYDSDMIVAVKPTKKPAKKTTVCVPETVPPSAMRPMGKSSEMPTPFAFVCIFLLCIAMLFLLIHSFSSIQDTAGELSGMKKELESLKETDIVLQSQLEEKYGNIDLEESAKELGMIKIEDKIYIPLSDVQNTDAAQDANTFSAFVTGWSAKFEKLLAYLK